MEKGKAFAIIVIAVKIRTIKIILVADRVNTVSPTYAAEIQTPEFGYGLDEVLRMVNYKLSGILNGIDYDTFDPKTDKALPYKFSSGKTSRPYCP